ncbi:MAG: hypothetical protein A2Z91_09575 [Deltaproteobacteria bacterium GWA2_38_16]|nr:MAG: hypothetical protein A2Z91_09575 [Deltaproteobacteria bacterium GWA2_38_16]OGQ02458.1 MAG: hypothetical protein A3D19_09155 [Deltaproteobacteria bacterium RIFCSPHIGHO2_02_FULL_38_15]OGQ60005.1 MAG: hypothetical protein A3G92_02450 [Deltaproteobacteria bacterium RIFCSPLOWO2_12_FULL_38_8]HBQ21088.1 hypothetical protein [Deltaproteobacteria bacterium]
MTYLLSLLAVLLLASPLNASSRSISFPQALKIAFENNLDIKIADLDKDFGKTFVHTAESVYDTTFTALTDWKDDRDKPVSALLSGPQNKTANVNVGLTKKLWLSGTTLDLQFKNVYKETTATSSTNPLYWDPRLELNITQPILKNFLGLNDRRNLKIGYLKEKIKNLSAEQKISTTLASVAKLYWEFSAAQETVEIKQQALEHAQKLYQANQKKIKLGTIEETDLLASHANVLARENDLLEAQNHWQLIHEKFKNALQEKSPMILTPKDALSFEEEKFEKNTALKKAFQARKDFLIAKEDIESKNLDLKVSRNALYPQIDLVGTIASNGLNKHYNDALSDINSFDYPTYYAGVSVKFPLGNNAAQSTYLQSRAEKLNALYTFQKLEQEITLDIDQKIRTLSTEAEKAKTSGKIKKLLKQKMFQEEKKFNQGRSSINFVIQFQEDYLNSATQHIQSLLEYQKTVIDFRKSEGTLLGYYLKAIL